MNDVLDERARRGPKNSSFRHSVGSRILSTYVVVLFVLVAAAIANIVAFRHATEDAELLRSGLVPLALRAEEFRVAQESVSSALVLLDVRNREVRARELSKLKAEGRTEVLRGLRRALRATVELGEAFELEDLVPRIDELEAAVRKDQPLLAELESSLVASDEKRFSEVRAKLLARSGRLSRSLSRLERDIAALTRSLTNAARSRENVARTLLFVLAGVTLLVGVLMALYARRVVSPIALVTKRARIVAGGELESEMPLASADEIGELSRTFEAMVTSLVEGREKVLGSERLAAIGKMAAHVTHEIRNPLNSIALNLELLEDEIPRDNDEARALLGAILGEVERLRALTGQYLSMARKAPLELVPLDLRELVVDVVNFVRPEFGASGLVLALELADEPLTVELDQAQFRQALLNLLRNAREASESGSLVRLVARIEGGNVVLAVEDSGAGVPSEEAPHLFDPFFTTKEHGTGLGLAVTEQIVRAHGGKLWYEPGVDGGSRFVLSLPFLPAERAE